MRNLITAIIIHFLPALAMPQITVAIWDFQNQTDRLYLDAWEQKIPEFLTSELSQARNLVLVERQRLRAVLDEQALTMTGAVDTSTAQHIGKLLSAKYVITGTIHETDQGLRIDARIISVSSGKLVSEKVQGRSPKHLDRMVVLLGNNLRFRLTGAGEFVSNIRLKKFPTGYFLAATLGSGLATILVNEAYINKRDDYRAAVGLEEFDPLYNSANRLHTTRTVLACVTGVGLAGTLYCWLRNMHPEMILASSPAILPYWTSYRGEYTVGLQISF